MYPPAPDQYQSFLGSNSAFVRYVEFYDEDRLVMVSVMDELADAVSAIYTFFEPTYASNGLGNYAILWQIDYTRRRRLPFLYLGFWIDECEKMNYKAKFAPNQIFDKGLWREKQLT